MINMTEKTVLVTGGLGYIGSHTVVELLVAGYQVIVVDNLSNSERFILDRIIKIAQKEPVFYQEDVCDLAAMSKIFKKHQVDVVIHFAAFKSVGESVEKPLLYYQNNLISLLNILQLVQENGVEGLVFSSSATVYGEPDVLPATEETPFKKALSAYGSTKQMGEEIIEMVTSSGVFKAISLRYFNPVGAHETALIGELPKGIPNNLFPYVTQTAKGKLAMLTVFGDDYNTTDGTCVRDYIHVVDLAKAHLAACKRLINKACQKSSEVYNIGTGNGTTVLEIIKQFEATTGKPLPYKIGARRPGDAEAVYADSNKAEQELLWKATLNLKDMIQSSWAWENTL